MKTYKIDYFLGGKLVYQIVEADSIEAACKWWREHILATATTTCEFENICEQKPTHTVADLSDNLLQQVFQIVYERSEEKTRQYGPFAEGMERAAQIFNGMSGLNLEAKHVYLMLIALKFSRDSYNFKFDNLLDAMAYMTQMYEHYKTDYDATK